MSSHLGKGEGRREGSMIPTGLLRLPQIEWEEETARERGRRCQVPAYSAIVQIA